MKTLCETDKKKSDQKSKKHYKYICKCGFMSNEKRQLCKAKKIDS